MSPAPEQSTVRGKKPSSSPAVAGHYGASKIMENLKQYLIEEIDKEIKEKEVEIKNSDEELKILEAKFKVEKKLSEMKDIYEEIKEDVKYSVGAIKDMILMEKNRNVELRKELKMLQARKQVINKFEDGEL